MPSCTFLMGYVLDGIVTDGRDMFFSWFCILDCVLLSFVQGRFERYSRVLLYRKEYPQFLP